MINSTHAFHALRRVVRSIPDGIPGKNRVARLALRQLRKLVPVRIPDRYGNELWCPSLEEPIATALFANGIYEPDTLANILTRLDLNGTYLDVGANVGAIALPVAALRPDVRVVCVEADPDIATILRRNIVENARQNVTVIECLAGPESDASVKFYRAPTHKFGMGSVGPQFETPPVVLRQRAADDVLDELELSTIDVVKLDIEGAELGALRGLVRRLNNGKKPAVIFEFNDWAEARIPGQSPGDAQAFLMSLGYRLFVLAPDGSPGTALNNPITAGAAMILAIAEA
jgi:FkbM family methyltransferase